MIDAQMMAILGLGSILALLLMTIALLIAVMTDKD